MKILVLDLDETLVSSSLESTCSHCIKRFVSGAEYYTMIRPGANAFLRYASEHFDCFIWSTGQQPYIEDVWTLFDVKGFKLWGRPYCERVSCAAGEPFEKPLQKICEDLSKIFIIDNTPSVFSKTPLNGIEVRTWRGDQSDTELEHLSVYLDWLREQPTVQRDHKQWRLETLCLRAH